MKIAYIVPTYPVSSFIFNEMVRVIQSGHDILIVPLHSTRCNNLTQQRLESEVRPSSILPAPLLNLTIMRHAIYTLVRNPVRVVRTMLRLHWASGLNPYSHCSIIAVLAKGLATAWWAKRFNVDRIHAHFGSHTATCAAIAGSVAGLPFSFTCHAYDIYCTSKAVRNETLNWKLRQAMQVFAVSEHGATLLRSRLPVSERSKVYRVYVGIPLDIFRERPALEVTTGIKLLCVANLEEKKGHDTLLDACALLMKWHIPFQLVMVGRGPLRHYLGEKLRRLGLSEHAELKEPIPQEDVARELASCHVFVMPCRMDRRTGDMDGIPTVFMEAMATGRPVISCPISGIPELVRDGNTGMLVSSNDPIALAHAISRLRSDGELRKRLGENARALAVRQHDARKNTAELLRLMAMGQDVITMEKTRPALSTGLVHDRCNRTRDREGIDSDFDETVKRPALSVIIACRNERQHIEICLRSILAQRSAGDLEIIVVDGMSDDGTRDIIFRMAEEAPQIKIVDNDARITPSAFNAGIARSRGEYIAILGAHSQYARDYLAVCVEMLREHPEVSCTGGPIISKGSGVFGRAVATAMAHPVGIGNAKHRYPHYEGYAEGACYPVFRREVFEKVGLYDEAFVRNQDDEFNYRVVRGGGKIFISPRARCTYHVRERPYQLFKQYFEYGFWRVAVLRKHRQPASVRQLVPGTFVLLLLSSLACWFALPESLRLASAALPSMYGLTLAGVATAVGWTNGWRVGVLFPVAAMIMHSAYGMGFIWGILRSCRPLSEESATIVHLSST